MRLMYKIFVHDVYKKMHTMIEALDAIYSQYRGRSTYRSRSTRSLPRTPMRPP
jgi:hypothetical protein